MDDDNGSKNVLDLAAERLKAERVKGRRAKSKTAAKPGTLDTTPGEADRQSPDWAAKIHFGSDKLPLKTLLNIVILLSDDPRWSGVIGFNAFRQCIEKRKATPYGGQPGPWADADTAETIMWLNQEHFIALARERVDLAVLAVAHRHPFNPAQDRLRALADQWDGTARLENWLVKYLAAAESPSNREYLSEIGGAWLKGVAARVLIPGCKRDDVLVFRGPQGWKKSTAAHAIADFIIPEAFTDSVDLNNLSEAKIQIRGIIIAELGELAGLARGEVEAIKAFVATKSDHFREKFGRYAQDFPRTVSFIGTTNDKTFLKDPTGNRRWWPITLAAPIDIPRLEAVLPQLIGEAARRVLNGEAWHVTAENALQQAEQVRDIHYDEDVWTDPVLKVVANLEDDNRLCNQPITTALLLDAIGIARHQQTAGTQRRVANILRTHGYEEARCWIDRKNNRYQRYWKKLSRSNDPVTSGYVVTSAQEAAEVCNHMVTGSTGDVVTNPSM